MMKYTVTRTRPMNSSETNALLREFSDECVAMLSAREIDW